MSTKQTESEPKRSTPTLQEVAQAAGVTVGTASKALRGQGKISDSTRERVRQAADRLGFHSKGRTMGQHRTFGLLTSDNGRFSIPLLRGIESVETFPPTTVFLCQVSSPQHEQQQFDALLEKQIDGIVIMADRTNIRPAISNHKSITTPVIYAYARVNDPQALCLLPDDEQGGYLATEHLLQLGRRNLAHITGPLYYEAVQLRAQGMRNALLRWGFSSTGQPIVSGRWDEAWGYEAAQLLLDKDPTIDAIFCGSDQLARGTIEALQQRGIRIPEDIAIVGFDNWEFMAQATHPKLTTIDMNLYELGRQASLALLDLRANKPKHGTIRFPCSLVIRDSCGASLTNTTVSKETPEICPGSIR